jgi:2-polyprenyl-3-methyl-5-hydroxy-6-metoxy-1,4-benzoquinol methylase
MAKFDQVREREILKEAKACSGTILDVGCGPGKLSKHLVNANSFVVGLDIQKNFKCPSNGVQFVVGDALNLPFTAGTFDAVTSFDMIEHLVDRQGMQKEFNRVMKSNGLLLITTPNRGRLNLKLLTLMGRKPVYPRHMGVDSEVGDVTHIHEYTREELTEELTKNGFKANVRGLYFGFVYGFPPKIAVGTGKSWKFLEASTSLLLATAKKVDSTKPQETDEWVRKEYEVEVEKFLKNPFPRKPNKDIDVIIKYFSPSPLDRILDIGCGLGTVCWLLANKGGHVTGIDTSESAINIATKTYSNSANGEIDYIHGDISAINGKKFSKILCNNVLEHMERKDAQILLSEMSQLLLPRGVIVIGVPIGEARFIRRIIRFLATGHWSATKNPSHLWSISLKDIQALINDNDLKITDVFTFSYSVPFKSLEIASKLAGKFVTTNAIIRASKLE